MNHARSTILALGLVIPLGLAACGSSTASGSVGPTTTASAATTPATTTPATTVVSGGSPAAGATISGYSFKIGTVTAGTPLTVTNKDSVTHTFTSADGGVDVKVPAGGSASVTFAKAGTFKVVCKIHASMQASVTVG